jgi:hypothetical protein
MPPARRTNSRQEDSEHEGRATKSRQQPKKTATKKATKQLSSRHKAALATGRTEGRHVSAYLDALEANRPRRGRQRTVQSIERQLTDVRTQFDTDVRTQLRGATGIKKLELVSRRIKLENELDAKKAGNDLGELRKNFVRYAGGTRAAKASGSRRSEKQVSRRPTSLPPKSPNRPVSKRPAGRAGFTRASRVPRRGHGPRTGPR